MMLEFGVKSSAELVAGLLLAVCIAGSAYLLIAAYAVRSFRRGAQSGAGPQPPVTVLKPVCGDEPGLYDNLRSFCEQDYPRVQVVFGVREPTDSAVPVVRRLVRDLPDADLALVVDERQHGSNRKVGNLVNMMRAARYDVLLVADSDIRVDAGYLREVVAPLADPTVGAVTCLYVGRAVGRLWSVLSAMSINYGFLPLVLVGRLVGSVEGCFGATIVLRREVLERIGGFEALSDQLADDFALGEAVRALGWQVALSGRVVDNMVSETELRGLFQHELRWARTIRAVAPLGYAFSAVTLPVPLALVALMLAGGSAGAWSVLLLVLCCRLTLLRVTDRVFGLEPVHFWMVPLRDTLSLLVYLTSFFGKRVVWRNRRFRAGPDGRLMVERGSR